jgi:hypothetical protein
MQANGRGRHSAERFIKGYNNKMALLVFSVPPVASDMPQIYGTHRQASESFGARRCASVPIGTDLGVPYPSNRQPSVLEESHSFFFIHGSCQSQTLRQNTHAYVVHIYLSNKL